MTVPNLLATVIAPLATPCLDTPREPGLMLLPPFLAGWVPPLVRETLAHFADDASASGVATGADVRGASARLAAAGVLPILVLSLAIKVAHVPERFVRRGLLDFSPMHSHSLWHLGVFLCQLLYHHYYTQALAASCAAMA